VVTPLFHRIHHSMERRHFDKNFGGRLIVWDYLFGTMNANFNEYPKIGVPGYPIVETSRSPFAVAGYVAGHLAYPFVSLWNYFSTPREPSLEPETIQSTL
jgi:hypothetical protein